MRKTGAIKKGGSRQKPGQVRIIGGLWRRTNLPVPEVEGLRPTPDRVRETVFNWISHLIGNDWRRLHCLDLFAGTGAFGFEAASRGAAQVAMVDSSPAALRQLDALKERLNAGQVAVMRGDAFQVAQRLTSAGQRFDLVFLDPPYDQNLLPRLLSMCADLLTESGIVYAESSVPLQRKDGRSVQEWLEGWNIIRADRAGMVHFYLLQR